MTKQPDSLRLIPTGRSGGGRALAATGCLLTASLLLPLVPAGCGDPMADDRLSIVVESIDPAAVGTRGSVAVTLTGRNLEAVSSIRVRDMVAAAIVRDDRRLTFLAPPHQPGGQPLVLEGPTGETALPLQLFYRAEQSDLAVPQTGGLERHGSADEILHRKTPTDYVDD